MNQKHLPKPGLAPRTLISALVLVATLGIMIYWLIHYFPYGA